MDAQSDGNSSSSGETERHVLRHGMLKSLGIGILISRNAHL